jgi:hypothetical protein
MKANLVKSKRGGPRPGSGRPPKLDKVEWKQISVFLRKKTIERLREGAGGKFFGQLLQEHLDRYPPPTRAQYLSPKRSHVWERTYEETRDQWERDLEKQERAQARREKLLNSNDPITKGLLAIMKEEEREAAKKAREAAKGARKANDRTRKAVRS